MIDKRPGSGGARDELVFVGLGGLGEIGMNLYLYGFGPPDARKWLMVDLGITFPEGEFDPGIDVILPDVRFIEENRGDLVGLVLTHAHEDHIGAVIELWPRLKVPDLRNAVHGRHAARQARRVRRRSAAARSTRCRSTPASSSDRSTSSSSRSRIPSPRPNAVALRTPQGLVFHTGDWKIDATPVIGTPLDEAPPEAARRRRACWH